MTNLSLKSGVIPFYYLFVVTMTATRLIAVNQALSPVAAPTSLQQVRYFAVGVAGQTGLVLKGTDGNDYVLFIDLTGTPNIGIQRA
ncbi:hypothetical protein [Paenibacillus etheri]|nr:hypothetical protein [Paenibacillus etheri]